MVLKDWEKQPMPDMGWFAERYWNSNTTQTLQVGEYRKADEMDKRLNTHYEWHGKFYVKIWYPQTEKLFKTKSQALAFAKSYMRSH